MALATQTLSNSVADALLAAKEIGLDGFTNCGATVNFIKVLTLGISCAVEIVAQCLQNGR